MDYQTNMVKLAKNIARTAQDMVSISSIIPKLCLGGVLWYAVNMLTETVSQVISLSKSINPL